MDAADFVNLLVSALLLAGIYAAMSVGMTIIYGVMKIVNLAHAGFLMLGAYYVLELHERLNIDPLVGSVLAFLVWNGVVIWLSTATGWWGPKAPGIHFGGSVAVAIIPLLFATWLFGRR